MGRKKKTGRGGREGGKTVGVIEKERGDGQRKGKEKKGRKRRDRKEEGKREIKEENKYKDEDDVHICNTST